MALQMNIKNKFTFSYEYKNPVGIDNTITALFDAHSLCILI